MKHTRANRIALLAALLAPCATPAAERGWYLGAAYSDISPDLPDSSVVFNEVRLGDDGYKIFAGYRAFDWLAIEADYGDFGDVRGTTNIVCVTTPCPTHFSTSASAFSVSALGLYAIGRFDLFARVGFAGWSTESELHDSVGASVISNDDSGTDALFGAGAQYNFSRVIARLEYGRFEFGDSEADVWSVGLAWSFH
ncbi:MAG TPA: porin family protein [Steroidobacteraceae bacterium]|nr:porin family protein [Steroidobacteraceae bacterium]